MSRNVTVAVIQAVFNAPRPLNIAMAETYVFEAASRGANVILLPELFEGPYFCKTKRKAYFAEARPFKDNPTIARFAKLAETYDVVLPISFFEAGRNGRYYNSIAMIDAGGEVLGFYRKSHIPQGPGYEERFYFSPGETGYRAWRTKFGTIGVGICWDQWFPECARAMALMGAEMLLYPTSIGSEPHAPQLDTRDRWQRVMTGHAVANVMPVAAANRVGDEDGQVFYGSSFIVDDAGNKVAELDRVEANIAYATFDLDAIAKRRADWGLLSEHRRPDLCNILRKGRKPSW